MEEKKIIKIKLYAVIILALIFISIVVLILILSKSEKRLYYIKNIKTQNSTKKESSEKVEVVATLDDEITTNSAWCGTLQLVWNDMINNVVKQDVVFTPQLQVVKNLNKQIFKENQLSERDYYKVYDLLTQDLKKEIEENVKSKFNEKTDILDNINWANVPKNKSEYKGKDKKYLFYAMLEKTFNFKKDFDELENGQFGEKYKDIKYFGIDEKSNSELYSQVEVLYYNSKYDFAIILNTKENEQVILCRGAEGNTFGTIYNNLVKKTNSYTGNKAFTENDYLKVPNIKFNTKKTFEELCNKTFYSKNGETCNIDIAIQIIQVDMNKSGGKIKSEAGTGILEVGGISIESKSVEHRYFYLDDEFTMFLKEADKDIPYFAANIEDITLFQ